MDDNKPNSIDKIPKTLFDAQLIIKKKDAEIAALNERSNMLSISLSKANKKIEHLIANANAPAKMIRSVMPRWL